ncbi:MAG TPA: hypothetical protein VLE97_11365 [Gaiellaceae bacterium]|nr:hypothetical protein [Gaiellaceae bacterium]
MKAAMAAPTEPLSNMTILELTRLLSAQDDRWGDILTYAQSTHHPLAPAGIAFFKRTWRPFMGGYFEHVAARYDSAGKAPSRVVNWVLDTMSNYVFPAARKAGFSDNSFVIPDITIDKPAPAEPPMVATRGQHIGAEAPDRENDVGQKIALGGVGIIFLGMGIYAYNVRRLAKTPL